MKREAVLRILHEPHSLDELQAARRELWIWRYVTAALAVCVAVLLAAVLAGVGP